MRKSLRTLSIGDLVQGVDGPYRITAEDVAQFHDDSTWWLSALNDAEIDIIERAPKKDETP